MPSIAVIGAGLTGLSAAYRLKQLSADVTVYEAADRSGGVVTTDRRDGYVADLGPNSFVESDPRVSRLIEELGLLGDKVDALPAARHRFILRRGRPVPLPMSPKQVVTTRLLSPSAKLAIAGETLVAPSDAAVEESIGAFVRRRFNQEVLDYVANPFVAGVYAGDPELLSLRHALPKVAQLEREHGSVLGAAVRMAQAKADDPLGPASRPLRSFRAGLQQLPDALAREVGATLRLRAAVTGVRRDGDRWTLFSAFHGPSTHDAVVYTAPAHRVSEIEFEMPGEERLATLASIPHPPVTVLALGFARDDVKHPLDGFGLLVPDVERRHILGVVFSSSIFPGRAPEGNVLVTAFVGGTRNPDLAGADLHTLSARVMDDLRPLLGVRGELTFRACGRWPEAIPQYVVGFGRFRDAMDEVERRNPGFYLAGTYRDGVSVGDAIVSGLTVADRLVRDLAERDGSPASD